MFRQAGAFNDGLTAPELEQHLLNIARDVEQRRTLGAALSDEATEILSAYAQEITAASLRYQRCRAAASSSAASTS